MIERALGKLSLGSVRNDIFDSSKPDAYPLHDIPLIFVSIHQKDLQL